MCVPCCDDDDDDDDARKPHRCQDFKRSAGEKVSRERSSDRAVQRQAAAAASTTAISALRREAIRARKPFSFAIHRANSHGRSRSLQSSMRIASFARVVRSSTQRLQFRIRRCCCYSKFFSTSLIILGGLLCRLSASRKKDRYLRSFSCTCVWFAIHWSRATPRRGDTLSWRAGSTTDYKRRTIRNVRRRLRR
ncbi:unnamed protein product [Trichogramma brassicae]|uniref:Uncharacterized protein n=1 Tax=Trichogramma brassicae TaxID=86971 RepID=A0A6H5I1Z3_9HYME|nr:unnamed protein product [Trichogramma brassicae]